MGFGYIAPLDRPSRIWCRVCGKKINPIGWKQGEEEINTPADLEDAEHDGCPNGSMVWCWDEHYDAPPDKKGKPTWKPKCGDPKCDGMCGNLACTPPKVEPPLLKPWAKFVLTHAGALSVGGVLVEVLHLLGWL